MNDSVNGNSNGNEVTGTRLAALVGFEEPAQDPIVLHDSAPGSSDTAQYEDLKEEDPRDIQTNRSPWTKPFNKAGFVLGGTSVLMLSGYLLMDNLTYPVVKQSQRPTLQKFPVPNSEVEHLNETGLLKAEVALGDQADAMQKLNEKNSPKPTSKSVPPIPASSVQQNEASKRSPVTSTSREDSKAQAVAVKSATLRPVTVRSHPRPAGVRPMIMRSHPVRPTTEDQSPRTVSVAQTVPHQLPSARVELNPMEQWLASSQLGSYGQLSVTETLPIEAQSRSVGNQSSVDYAPASSASSKDSEQPVQTELINDAEEAPILHEQPRQSVKAGTRARAILATPFATDAAQNQTLVDHFTVILASPLIAADGAVALAAHTQLVTEVRALSLSGMVRLVAVAAIVEQNGQLTEIALPENAIQIRGAAGKPLIAKQLHNKGGEIARMDIGRFLFGAIEKGASLFNRPISQSVVSGFGGLSSTTENRDPNLLAGVLEGGSEAILSDLDERNKRAIQAISQRPNTWFLPAGSDVEVFVNQSVALDETGLEQSQAQ